jgi:hypothetical protein
MPRKAKFIGGNNSDNGGRPSIIQVIGGFAAPATATGQAVASAATAAGFVPMPPVMDPLSALMASLNANPYMIGIFYIFLNMGGRFLSMELTKRQEWFLSQQIVRPFILFAVLFIATRNIGAAFWTTVGILSVLWFFANENRPMCLIPSWRNDASSKEEQDKLYQERMKRLREQKHEHEPDNEPDHNSGSEQQGISASGQQGISTSEQQTNSTNSTLSQTNTPVVLNAEKHNNDELIDHDAIPTLNSEQRNVDDVDSILPSRAEDNERPESVEGFTSFTG